MLARTVFGIVGTAAIIAGAAFATGSVAQTNAAAPKTMHIRLRAQAFSGVTGTATLTYNPATKMTTVIVTVHNLEPGTVHPSHIHAGQCSTNGPVLAALASITANSTGSGTATTTVAGSFNNKRAYINVHLGPGLALTQYTVLACGELTKQ